MEFKIAILKIFKLKFRHEIKILCLNEVEIS